MAGVRVPVYVGVLVEPEPAVGVVGDVCSVESLVGSEGLTEAAGL